MKRYDYTLVVLLIWFIGCGDSDYSSGSSATYYEVKEGSTSIGNIVYTIRTR